MRQLTHRQTILLLASLAASILLSGCTIGRFAYPMASQLPQQEANQANSQVDQQVERLAQAYTADGRPPAAGPPQVHWDDGYDAAPLRRQMIVPAQPKSVAWSAAPLYPRVETQPLPPPSEPTTSAVKPPAATAPPKPPANDELLDLLMAHLRSSDDSPMSKALIAAAVSLADPNQELDPAILAQLDRKQRDVVRRYQ